MRFINKKIFTIALITSLFAGLANAELLGLPNGRSANPGNLTDLSVELGFVTGDFGTDDYQNIALRVNYRVAPEVVVFGNVGTSEFGALDGTPYGLGILYHLSNQRISQILDIAGKFSYHTGDYSFRGVDADLSGISFEVLFSGIEPLSDNGLSWYGNFGFHRLTIDLGPSDSSNEIGLGGGLLLPVGPGEAYVGLDLIDELTFGVGFRYFVQ